MPLPDSRCDSTHDNICNDALTATKQPPRLTPSLDRRRAINRIYTGVAGTGKTYQLLQLAQQYTHTLTAMSSAQRLDALVADSTWREVICLVLLDLQAQGKQLVKVPEILEHDILQARAQRSDNRHLSATLHQTLSLHRAHTGVQASDSAVLGSINESRAALPLFDKDSSGAWYLLPDAREHLHELQQRLVLYRQPSQPQQVQRYVMLSFHQAYGYDEFVEGIRPVLDEHTGQMRYQIRDGAFLKLCMQAQAHPELRYALLIDELNRANVAQVFGELMSLIEPDKRAGQPGAMQVRLAYSQRLFAVPSNVDIYATMNDQDHSLSSLDMAFRRRFEFVSLLPNPQLLGQVHDSDGQVIELSKLLAGINQRLCEHVGSHAQLGHAYLLGIDSIAELLQRMVTQVLPQLLSVTQYQPSLIASIVPTVDSTGDGFTGNGSTAQTPWLYGNAQLGSYQLHPEVLALAGQLSTDQSSEQIFSQQLSQSASPLLDSIYGRAAAFTGFYSS